MSEMLDRVTLALYRRDPGRQNATMEDFRRNGNGFIYVALARAAIEAMREPTEAMVLAGFAVDEGQRSPGSPLQHWTAMIDEALKP